MTDRFDAREDMDHDGAAYLIGYHARQKGQGKEANPFRAGSKWSMSWSAGWVDRYHEEIAAQGGGEK